MSRSLFRSLCSLFAAVVIALPNPAQCGLAAGPGDPASMPRGRVACSVLWDPDGAGPAPTALVVGGSFVVGPGGCQVAMWDGTDWTSLGSPSRASYLGVEAILVHNGDLVVAVDGDVYRRTTTGWTPLGLGSNGHVNAMTVFNNELVVGGDFTTIGGAPANCIARWTGTTWAALGVGIGGGSYPFVASLAVYTFLNQSALYVGGAFTTAGGSATNNLAIWTGSTWFATPGCNGTVYALAVRLTAAVTTSYLILGGTFTVAGGVPVDKVARFSVASNTWSTLGAMPTSSPCTRLLVRSFVSSYEVVAGQVGTTAIWAGGGWNQLGPPVDTGVPASVPQLGVTTVSWFGGRYVVGLDDSAHLLGGVRAFDGVTWQPVDGAGIPRAVSAVLPVGGDTVIGGSFATISGVPVNGIARGAANAWQPLGNGLTGGHGSVDTIVRMPNGDLVAGGSFAVATGGAADRIARWNGVSWQPLGLGTNGPVQALVVMPNGELIAGGSFTVAGGVAAGRVARWNGAAWSDVGGGCNGAVRALTVLTTGELIAGGEFDEVGPNATPASRIARWNGSAWLPMGSGFDTVVLALAPRPGGGLLVGGAFHTSGTNQVGPCAVWNGSSFSPVPYSAPTLAQVVRAVAVLPDGSFLAGGDAWATTTPQGVVRTTVARSAGVFDPWEPMLVGGVIGVDAANALAVDAAGEGIVGGYFHGAGPAVSANVARIASTCPASATNFGAGCSGSGGVNVLAATELPWTGYLRARATGMPTQGIALVLVGLTQVAVPIAALLTEGAPGCNLLASPDLVLLGVPTAGVLDTSVYVAPAAAMVGVPLYQQVVPFQDLGVGPLVVTATNGLAFVGGAY